MSKFGTVKISKISDITPKISDIGELGVKDLTTKEMLSEILLELKKMNISLAYITDAEVTEQDIN